MTDPQVDIKENEIFAISSELLNTLLKDHTLSTDSEQVNIFWATDNYSHLGKGYQYNDQITIESITGANGDVIVPRALKSRERQQQRSREMAEVFTPSWICNKQNNLVDEAWFGREGVFNTEVDNSDGSHSWIVNTEPVVFPEGKTWHDYVKDTRMEITCGEAPYLVSRYDTVTGIPIPVERRIGMLDRKLRVVGENIETSGEWLKAAQDAYKSIYGFEWQGDNLVLAREALLYTFIEYYRAKFGKDPQLKSIQDIADIVSWNIWQMDGLKGVIPNSCEKAAEKLNFPKQLTFLDDSSLNEMAKPKQLSLFGEEEVVEKLKPKKYICPGCKYKNMLTHVGTYCKIMDWEENKPIKFISLYNG